MDVMVLNPSTYLPWELVEGYDSMIWTERYLEASEFKLKSSQIQYTKSKLPVGTFISLRDSKEVMVVESCNITEDEEGTKIVEVSGRSYESFLENRVMFALEYQKPWKVRKNYRYSEAMAFLIWTYLVSKGNQDASKDVGVISDKYGLENVCVSLSTSVSEQPQELWFEAGNVYDKFLEFGNLGKLGIRCIRPSEGTAKVVHFDISAATSRGNMLSESKAGITELRFDIFTGVNRTKDQTNRKPVIFHYSSGDLKTPSYLESIKDYKTSVMVVSSIGAWEIFPSANSDTTIAGTRRRQLFMDGGSPAENQTNDDFLKQFTELARKELAAHKKVHLFDGEVSPTSQYVYGRDYFLGDKISIIAEFDFVENMQVTEYIRTEDVEGDRGYPTLSIIE
jgi:hypothetical protein